MRPWLGSGFGLRLENQEVQLPKEVELLLFRCLIIFAQTAYKPYMTKLAAAILQR